MRRLCLILLCALAARGAELRLGFVDPALPGDTPRRNAAALAFARTRGTVTRLQALPGGGWRAEDGGDTAPECFDLLWFHQGDAPDPSLGDPALADLLTYAQNGGALLLSGCAGQLAAELGLEPTPPRVLGPTDAAYASGIIVPPDQRAHPAFAGLDVRQPVLLTSLGGNALADFYGTAGPHGTLLADGNAGLGERPLVEYSAGAGRVIFVGWRLPDFTTAADPYRPNLERLFTNLLGYLAAQSRNHARLVAPPGKPRYVRLCGVPFLRAETPVALQAELGPGETAVWLSAEAGPGESFAADGLFVHEGALPAGPVLALTVAAREHPAQSWVAARRAEQAEQDAGDREKLAGLRVVRPQVAFAKGPLQPLSHPPLEQSVLLGRSAFMTGPPPKAPFYEPVEDGGFRITGGTRAFNRPIVWGQNKVWTGDVPRIRLETNTGNGTYAADRVYPLWPRADIQSGSAYPSMGALRLATPAADGTLKWLDERPGIVTTFRSGYTLWEVPGDGWRCTVTVAPSLHGHGLVCRVAFDRAVPLTWEFGGMRWSEAEPAGNQVIVAGNTARLTDPSLPNGLALCGWDGKGSGEAAGQVARFTAATPASTYHVAAAWGVPTHDEALAQQYAARLDTPFTAAWPAARDRLKQLWYETYVGAALNPEERLTTVLKDPGKALDESLAWWDRRRGEFQIRTPDPQLTALINWERCRSEYHRQGPGLVLGTAYWMMYSHISTGWYGKQWGGDHQALDDCLRLYGAMQTDDGFVRWVSPSMFPFHAENNTAYWVDQVWRHYTWTGDKPFVRDLWPAVKRAVAWQRKQNDPDGDLLFRDFYEYWNCDSNGKGPKSAAPSAMSWTMLDRAARMAEVAGDGDAATEYRGLADKCRERVLAELWNEGEGRLGSIGAEGFWRGHPQTWEEYLAVLGGRLAPTQGRTALRWLADHYGFEPTPGVHLLACSDWWPIRWSTQWVPTGDTCLAVLAGMKCGDVDFWWPYLQTVVKSAYLSDFPGIAMGISNQGVSGGDQEDVDSVDPHVHLAVRGLFGIEPALQNGEIGICPAFPADWREASIRTPDVSYTYRREGGTAVFVIHSDKPLVKRVRANLLGEPVVTPAETDSTVRAKLGPALPALPASTHQPILWEQDPPKPAAPLAAADRAGQVLFDLQSGCNVTFEELSKTRFRFDSSDGEQTLEGWWGNPGLAGQPAPRAVEAAGVTFLTSGRPRPGTGLAPKNLIAVSSWPPQTLPASAAIPVGLRLRRLWLLLQSYVQPMKNYVVNGEVVVRYADGTSAVTALVPPYNLDCYFQHFAREGTPVGFGRLGHPGGFWIPLPTGPAGTHADALEVAVDATREIAGVEVRGTCSEGVIGVAGMTGLQ